MRPLWVHRNVEILQNRITCYIHSAVHGSTSVFSVYGDAEPVAARKKIMADWDSIKKEMDEILVEMDMEVISRKMYLKDKDDIEILSRPPVYGTPAHREPK